VGGVVGGWRVGGWRVGGWRVGEGGRGGALTLVAALLDLSRCAGEVGGWGGGRCGRAAGAGLMRWAAVREGVGGAGGDGGGGEGWGGGGKSARLSLTRPGAGRVVRGAFEGRLAAWLG